jgi:hypothetical protein
MLNGKGNGEVVALGFTAGFIAAAVVVLTATIVFLVGIGPALGAPPISLRPPDVYRPLVWGGFWGIPLGFMLRSLKGSHNAVGFLYFLAPVAALFFVFFPLGGLGFFGLKGGAGIMVWAILVNAPFGIVATLTAAALGGPNASPAGAVPRPVG